jgi:hypothetical protein
MSSTDAEAGTAGGRSRRQLEVTTPAHPEMIRHGGRDASTLVDLLDRVIDRGVVVAGDVVLSVAGVDLVYVGLRITLRGVDEHGGIK